MAAGCLDRAYVKGSAPVRSVAKRFPTATERLPQGEAAVLLLALPVGAVLPSSSA